MSLKLHELGPRLRLKLVKIEEGLCRGNVTWHAFIKKSKKEIKEQMDVLKKKRELKADRKKIQEENVKKKQDLKDLSKKKVNFQNEEETGKEEQIEDYHDVNIDESKDERVMNKKPSMLGKRKRFNK